MTMKFGGSLCNGFVKISCSDRYHLLYLKEGLTNLFKYRFDKIFFREIIQKASSEYRSDDASQVISKWMSFFKAFMKCEFGQT